MASPGGSYDVSNYLLRPAKQVERKLLVETLHLMASAGYPIRDYTYVGMGSIYYADFVMLHRYLYIDRMICAEKKQIPRRMKLNLPYGFINLHMRPIGEVAAVLERDRHHIVWLDYDSPLTPDILEDVDGFLQVLLPGSILLITVRADTKFCEQEATSGASVAADVREREQFEYYRGAFGDLTDLEPDQFARSVLPTTVARIIRSQMSKSLVSIAPVSFTQLFNFRYLDSTQMLTIGGVITAPGAAAELAESGVLDLPWVRQGVDPENISVPELTIHDKHRIDTLLQNSAEDETLDPGFEIRSDLVKNYVKYHRHYPTYVESLT